jgi:hypothetical protein
VLKLKKLFVKIKHKNCLHLNGLELIFELLKRYAQRKDEPYGLSLFIYQLGSSIRWGSFWKNKNKILTPVRRRQGLIPFRKYDKPG